MIGRNDAEQAGDLEGGLKVGDEGEVMSHCCIQELAALLIDYGVQAFDLCLHPVAELPDEVEAVGSVIRERRSGPLDA